MTNNPTSCVKVAKHEKTCFWQSTYFYSIYVWYFWLPSTRGCWPI